MNALGYMTECEHQTWSFHEVYCQHGSLTGTSSQPPLGRLFVGLPVIGPAPSNTRQEPSDAV